MTPSRPPRGRRTPSRPSPEELDAELYDLRPIGWPGELAFYLDAARAAGPRAAVLEVACGTGRVLLELARAGFSVTGVDRSPAALAIARSKLADGLQASLVEGDMRSFDAGGPFDLAIVPAHSFQFMATADDQDRALRRIRDHLRPGGRLVLHVDHDSLASLGAMDGSERLGRPIVQPRGGRRFRPRYAWTYDHAWQNATLRMGWDELDADDSVVGHWELQPMVLHVPSAVELEHALRGAGFEDPEVAGAFDRSPFTAESGDMIWTARRA